MAVEVVRGRLLLWLTAAVAAALVGMPAFRPVLAGGSPALVGPIVGAVVFLALAGTAAAAVRAAWLTAGAAFEELAWRGLALATAAAWTGVGVALLATSAGFALAHRHRLGRRAWLHLLTGGAFGAAFVCAGLWAAIAAHAVYNLLVDTGREPG